MKKAEEGNIVLLFMDASHFVLGCDYLGYIYSRVRRFVKTFSGRKRYNVLGAIDYVTKRILTVTNDRLYYCDRGMRYAAESRIGISRKDHTHHPGQCKIPKSVALVQTLAEELGIVLTYIPPYSPNLNLIERVWKFVKAELRSKYYDDFSVFQTKIDSIIESTSKEFNKNQKINRGKGSTI